MNNKFFPMRNQDFLKQGLEDLMDYLEEKIGPLNDKCMIEIGSYIGESTIIFAQRFGLVVSIDPYEDNYDINDAACKAAPFKEVEKEFNLNTQNYLNIIQIKLTSDDAFEMAKYYNINEIDFIYIDGLHTENQVKKDINNFKEILKKPFFISGHDYNDDWNGVVKAVNDTLGIPKKVFKDSSWIHHD